jgi:hypothetical protein
MFIDSGRINTVYTLLKRTGVREMLSDKHSQLACIIFTLTMLLSIPGIAQDDKPVNNEEDTELDLFDGDAERTKEGWPRFYISAGVTVLDADGGFSVKLPDGTDYDIINFDRAGLDERDSSYWLALNWRSANSRWGAWFGSWDYDVTGIRKWEDQVEIPGEDPIPAGAVVSSTFNAKWYILEATYSFYRSETVDTGVGFGLHTVDFDTTVVAEVQVGEETGKVVSNRITTLAPLPNLLVYLHWKFAPRWSLVSRYGYFSLDYKDYSGRMSNAHAMVNFHISPRWTVAGGYQFVNLDLQEDATDYINDYGVDFSGPLAYLRFTF